MSLRAILHKKKRTGKDGDQYTTGVPSVSLTPVPQIRFIRSDTSSQEPISPPVYDGDQNTYPELSPPSPSSRPRSMNPFRRPGTPPESLGSPPPQPRERRLSQLLHLDRGRSRNSSATSVNIPSTLPQLNLDKVDEQEREARWEERATVLVQHNPNLGPSRSPTSSSGLGANHRSSGQSGLNDTADDINIQEAIRLHEENELEKSTEMFRRLADPNGANNALSQVLYGLALRHGWGCPKSEEQAVTYLAAAASNSALIESQALQAGVKKGGALKGELVLAIYELGNCFRNGWGVQRDPAAARQYFETAANLGDTDAMNEVAWCYLEGFGGKKDKFMAAKYYRLAEQKGSKSVGNSWYVKSALENIIFLFIFGSGAFPLPYHMDLRFAMEHHLQISCRGAAATLPSIGSHRIFSSCAMQAGITTLNFQPTTTSTGTNL